MTGIRASVRPTASTGEVDGNGDIVGILERIGTAIDPGPYVERPGLDDRLRDAGADVLGVRRMLGLQVRS